ncbi:MAG: 2Fe-2S iron-sulfur cluster-binding protein [Acidobacteriota bacterium]|nr:2Fe-2S iron-sulfur cluster-binding protein [Acidobacteriota bacterium]
MVKVTLDGRPLELEDGVTIFAAALREGIEIPHLCYHPAFPPEGSCRMCLVEVEGSPKLELSCSTAVRDGMKILTASPRVVEARRQVLELLLSEHPLDCPICDKAGECRLQEYYERYGRFEGRFAEAREKREKKLRIGKNLILDRERCVLCTRCVRFLERITGTAELGVFRRGIRSEVGLFENETVDNNYAGNLVDLCPVGAITDGDFRFTSRTWFLEEKASICPHCGRGCAVRLDIHPGFPRVPDTRKVHRIRPRENPAVNGYWICVRGRYQYAYLGEGRATRILLANSGRETVWSWEKALIILVEKIKGLKAAGKLSRLSVILTTAMSNEELFLARRIFKEGLKPGSVYFVDPEDGEADGFLMTAERTANRRGARELGFDLEPPDLDRLSRASDILLIFSPFLAERYAVSGLQRSFQGIAAKYLFTTRRSAVDALVDIILPVCFVPEKSGSLTNCDGVTQRFSRAMEPPGDSRPEWRVLSDLGRELGMRGAEFESPSAESIFGELVRKFPFFG